MKKHIIKILMAVLIVIVVLCVIFVVSVLLRSKGKIKPFLDSQGNELEGSVAERVFIDINGKKNGMIIRGKNTENPVILYISGGPGVPQYWLNESDPEKYPNHIEDEYTVCWWDYYGEGLSYQSGIDKEELTTERYMNDAVAVTEYLKKRFGKEKIYLMAHSAGTPLGIRLAQKHPEEYYCYFAMGQMVDEGNRRYEDGYYFMKNEFEKTNNKKGLAQMNKLIREENGELIFTDRKSIGAKWENILLMAGCATTRNMRSDAMELFFPQIYSTCYKFGEKIDYWRGKALLHNSPYDDEKITLQEEPLQIPVYFLSGYYDYTTPVSLVKEFYEKIEAPEKQMYIFDHSAHSPLWEENDAVMEVIRKYAR